MAMKLNMLPPSVNNMSVRVFVRAAGIPVEEENVWGQTQEQEYLSKYPPGLTPTTSTPVSRGLSLPMFTPSIAPRRPGRMNRTTSPS